MHRATVPPSSMSTQSTAMIASQRKAQSTPSSTYPEHPDETKSSIKRPSSFPERTNFRGTLTNSTTSPNQDVYQTDTKSSRYWPISALQLCVHICE